MKQELLTYLGTSFSQGEIIFSNFLALLLCLFASYVYKKIHDGFSYSSSFVLTLVAVSIIICNIMMSIGSNIALSLGMVGALSVIRFRTVIKDPKDMAFLFTAIGIGLSTGSANYFIAIFSVLFLMTVMFVLHRLGFGKIDKADFILLIQGPSSEEFQVEFEGILKQYCSKYLLRSGTKLTDIDKNDYTEYTYSLLFKWKKNSSMLLSKLTEIKAIKELSLIANDFDSGQ